MSTCGNPSIDHDELLPRKWIKRISPTTFEGSVERLRFNKGKDCIKCKVNPGKIVIRHAVYCKVCFTPLVTLKFRRSLEPSVNAHASASKRPKLKAPGSLVLGFSGGLGSSVLLDMVHRTYFADEPFLNSQPRGGTNHPRSANVWSSCAVCYVEVCSAFPEARDRTNEIMTVLASYPKFKFIPLRLEYAFDDSWWRTISDTNQDYSQLAVELGKDGLYTEALYRARPRCDVTPVDAMRTYLESLPTQTAISSAIRILVRLLLLYTARTCQASHLLLGTSLTTLSISLISCISQGGGHSILEELQEEWHSGIQATKEDTGTIRVVRPLRDVTAKECTIFAWWNAIHVVGRDKQTRAAAGILGLTKDFIVGLEKDYPSTVSTIARTCAKLEPKSASLGLCILCQRPIQAGLDDWKNRIAIRSHSDTSRDLVHLSTPAPDSPDVLAASIECSSISTLLCYFCRTMLTSRGTRASKPALSSAVLSHQPPLSAPLPLWVSAAHAQSYAPDRQPTVLAENGELYVRKLQDEANQRNQIANFLLED